VTEANTLHKTKGGGKQKEMEKFLGRATPRLSKNSLNTKKEEIDSITKTVSWFDRTQDFKKTRAERYPWFNRQVEGQCPMQ